MISVISNVLPVRLRGLVATQILSWTKIRVVSLRPYEGKTTWCQSTDQPNCIWLLAIVLNSILLGAKRPKARSEAHGPALALPACQYSRVYHNYSLLYGRKAGNFTHHGKVKDMNECLRVCCKNVTCKMALMLEHNCYSVACVGRFCQTVPVKPLDFKPSIAHVIRRKGKHV